MSELMNGGGLLRNASVGWVRGRFDCAPDRAGRSAEAVPRLRRPTAARAGRPSADRHRWSSSRLARIHLDDRGRRARAVAEAGGALQRTSGPPRGRGAEQARVSADNVAARWIRVIELLLSAADRDDRDGADDQDQRDADEAQA